MIDLDTIIRIIDEGSTPVIVVLAYFMWKIWGTLKEFITEVKTLAEIRDTKIEKIHSDVTAVIKRLAGMENNNDK